MLVLYLRLTGSHEDAAASARWALTSTGAVLPAGAAWGVQ